MSYRCLLVDDEHLALALLEKYVHQIPDLEWVASCKSPVQAVELLQREPVDLLFLDIQLPLMSGINLLKHISSRPVTIFTTAYAQHAHEAYDLDAVDYLLKPFSFERFEHAVQKARAVLQNRQPASGPAGMLTVKADRQLIKIPFADIVYIEGWKEYVKIYTTTGKVVTLESLRNLENILPASHFLRVHKSYIVSKNQVQKFDGDVLVVGAARIPVARARKRSVLAALME
ncbi:MAG: response regulator transcription factor [Bacteroidetes bacterium]|nr:MAG: response regulator transcription factor [Bacteroidota bacterium]